MTLADLVSILIGVIGTGFAIYVALRSKQTTRPTLRFSPGLLPAARELIPKAYRKNRVTTVAYGARLKPKVNGFFAMCYCLENDGKLPVSNVRLALNYPLRNLLTDFSFVDPKTGQPAWGSDDITERKVHNFGSFSQVNYEISVIRPGESVVVADPLRFVAQTPTKKEGGDDSDTGMKALFRRLSQTEKFCDFFVVDIFLYSEDCPPVSHRINVLWFNTDSLRELRSLVEESLNAFWGGRYPGPGIYRNLTPRRAWLSHECTELVIPKLAAIPWTEGGKVYFESSPIESARVLVSLPMPGWNYYYSLRPDIERFRVKCFDRFYPHRKRLQE